MPLAIDASLLHPSTRLALTALEWLEERIDPSNILDLGCGNGILSLTANHLWQAQVLGCDISARAVADMRENIAQFAPEAAITALQSDGLKHPEVKARAPYDLIIANLLAQWQIGMAKEMEAVLAQDGTLLFSGILLWQLEGVMEALKTINIDIIQRFDENEWVAFVANRKPASSL